MMSDFSASPSVAKQNCRSACARSRFTSLTFIVETRLRLVRITGCLDGGSSAPTNMRSAWARCKDQYRNCGWYLAQEVFNRAGQLLTSDVLDINKDQVETAESPDQLTSHFDSARHKKLRTGLSTWCKSTDDRTIALPDVPSFTNAVDGNKGRSRQNQMLEFMAPPVNCLFPVGIQFTLRARIHRKPLSSRRLAGRLGLLHVIKRSAEKIVIGGEKWEDPDSGAEWKRFDLTRPSQMEMRGKKRDKRDALPKRQYWYSRTRSDRVVGQLE